MINKLLFGDSSIALTKGGLNASAERMRVISENVANVATPGYEAKAVQFEELIKAASESISMERTNSGHFQNSNSPANNVPDPKILFTGRAVPEGAPNNVDIEQELVLMKQNEIHFQALTQLLARKYRGLSDAMR